MSHHLTGGLHTDLHVGDHELQALILQDGLAEGDALLAVGNCLINGALGDTHSAAANPGTGHIQGLHGDLVALALGCP